jgi:hypothetical protein
LLIGTVHITKGEFMVNPLRGFISNKARLFEEIDVASEGIAIYDGGRINDLLRRVVDSITGRAAPITVGGDTVTLDRPSAEEFFRRNSHKFQGLLREGMSLQEKVLCLLAFLQESKARHLPGLPMGLLEEYAFGGKEGRQHIVGMLHQFESVLDVLEDNNFDIASLREELRQTSSKFVQLDREEFLQRIISANIAQISRLTSTLGRPEVREFAKFLIIQMRKKQSEKE